MKNSQSNFLKNLKRFLGWEGTDCEIDINECIGDVCQNGGTCIDLENDYHCKCRKGKNHKLIFNLTFVKYHTLNGNRTSNLN